MGKVYCEIPRRQRHCVHGNELFIPGSSYYSLLEPVREGYSRKDYCPDCWQQLLKAGGALSEGKVFWKSSVPEKQPHADPSSRSDERALELLKNYCLSEQQEMLDQAFMLAQLLTRKKILQLKQEVREENQVIQLYEVRQTEEMIAVRMVDPLSIQADLIQTALVELKS